MARRSAPVRAMAKSRWVMPDKLARRLEKLITQSREHQARLQREAKPLDEVYVELRERARARAEEVGTGEALGEVLAEGLGLAAAAAESLVGRSWSIRDEEQEWQMRPRDNQLACAAVLAQGDVAELDTGEGKTLCAALAAVCWSLVGRAHVVTANDYLAVRDFEWMSPIFAELGISVSSVDHKTKQQARKEAYLADVTYVSVKEVGADYLRDTLTSERQALLLPALETAILDEIDFILIDEARIPLILAQQVDASENLCHQFNEAVAELVAEQARIKAKYHEEIDSIPEQEGWNEKTRGFETTVRLAKLMLADSLDPKLEERFNEAVEGGDGRVIRRVRDTIIRFEKTKRKEELLEELLFTIDHRFRAVQLTENGLDRLQSLFGDLFNEPEAEDPDAVEAHRARLRAVHNLIAAHVLYRRDRDYIIAEGKVVLVDQSTGRPSFDRHLQHGLHRALEARECLFPALDHRTAAEITFPGFFQLYDRFCGTSGTCLELTAELKKQFKKAAVRVPPHRPVIRADFEDVLFRNREEKAEALIAEIELASRLEQPVLVGTSSVEQSEWVSDKLSNVGIAHRVLNARHHEKEARIIAKAGLPGAVTVATTMAGRGTDIRPAADLAQRIAAAAAAWLDETIAAGERKGARIELFSDDERELFLAALDERGLKHRIWRRKRRSTIIDVGRKPPSTAFPLSLGLRIIGFERLGASRLDRQLRGRTGRQGAPGSTRFYLALDDEIVLIHADRPKLAELRRKSRPLRDPLSGCAVRSGRGLIDEVRRAWVTWESLTERQRERLNKLDAVDQAQRRHYDLERRALLFAEDEAVIALAEQALERAVDDVVKEVVGEGEFVQSELERTLDNYTQVLFERRGLMRSLFARDESPKREKVVEHLQDVLFRIYDIARESHGEAMTQVERTVLLDALTEVWRNLSGERPELRQQSELYGYANRRPEDVYRFLAGKAYHQALADAARTAASVLVSFPLPREIKSSRTGLEVTDEDVVAICR